MNGASNSAMRDAVALVLIAAWCGAAVLVAASVAPAAFAVLPTRTLAGSLVGRVLPVVFLSGIVFGTGAALLTFPRARGRAVTALVAGIACAVAQFLVNPRIARIRAELGSALDTIAPDDARRVAFGRLHAISVAWLGVAMLAAVIFLILTLLAQRQRS